MDSWSHSQILAMLEGGNDQLTHFFSRHMIVPSSDNAKGSSPNAKCIFERRYETKAAQFYREQLAMHVKKVISNGEYKGREEARKKKALKKESQRSSTKEEGKKNVNATIQSLKKSQQNMKI